jgi:hypothetical protein
MVQNSIATPATHRWGNGSASEALNLPHHTLYRVWGVAGQEVCFKVRCGKRSGVGTVELTSHLSARWPVVRSGVGRRETLGGGQS